MVTESLCAPSTMVKEFLAGVVNHFVTYSESCLSLMKVLVNRSEESPKIQLDGTVDEMEHYEEDTTNALEDEEVFNVDALEVEEDPNVEDALEKGEEDP
ncbi:hypothetical protein KI387_042536, partial [Taxus chinensis]